MLSCKSPCTLALAILLVASTTPALAQDPGILTRLPAATVAHPGDTLRLPVEILNTAGAIAGYSISYVMDRPGLAVFDDGNLFDTAGTVSSGWEQVGAFKPSTYSVRIAAIADINLDHSPAPFASLAGTLNTVVVRIPCDPDTLSGTTVSLQPSGAQQFSNPQGDLLAPVTASGGQIHVLTGARGDLDYSGARDVIDVVAEINCAFRGSCPACAGLTADLDCDGDTDVVDVVLEIGVAFRGESLAPCP